MAFVSTTDEPIIEPDLPIVDAHHHLWYRSEAFLAQLAEDQSLSARAVAPLARRHARYLLGAFLADVSSGHNIRASVFIDARLMYRVDGPERLRSIGEVEYVNGVAAASASGSFGDARLCAAIVGGGVDLASGEALREVLDAHIRAGNGRYRGVRVPIAHDPDPDILGAHAANPDLMGTPAFRAGVRLLGDCGLSFDAFALEPQLAALTDLARACPQTPIALNHLGVPLGIGRYEGRREERFATWRDNIRALAGCANVAVKLGGIGMHFAGFDCAAGVSSERLAADWAPYVTTCIEAFGPDRCMFESNFPVDSAACSYAVLWNAFKRMTAGASADEKAALYSGTAAKFYRLDGAYAAKPETAHV